MLGLTPQIEGSSDAATCSFFAAGLWLRSRRQRLYRFAGLHLGSGHPRLRSLYCRKAPNGVRHALFVLSDDQLTRIFTQPTTLCAVLSQIVCVCMGGWVGMHVHVRVV